jgi:hypothetical protein
MALAPPVGRRTESSRADAVCLNASRNRGALGDAYHNGNVGNKFVDNNIVASDNVFMSGQALKRATGNWVVGEQFWDREVELSLLDERLTEGAHVLLTAPRRIGKTSLLKEASRRLEGTFWSGPLN